FIGEFGAQRAHGVADVLPGIGGGLDHGFRLWLVLSAGQASSAVPCMVSQPSWSCAQSLTFLPSAEGWPLRRNGCRSNVGRTALKLNDWMKAPGAWRRTRSTSSVASNGPCTIRPG